MCLRRGFSFSTYARMGEGGRAKEYAMRMPYTEQEVNFCMHSVIFSYSRYIHHMVKTFAMIIFLSVICFKVFFSMKTLIGYLKQSR